MSGRLLVCATPIGNLDDVTLRVLAALASADAVACEDTRHTRLLLERHGIQASLVSYHEHNEAQRAPELLARLRTGETLALVSDAGMPVVSDPGYVLVRLCADAGVAVEVLPGASAPPAALVASALPPDRWRFVGFLPRKRAELRALLAELEETLVAFESPRRLAKTLALLAEIDPGRRAAVCRELTKVHEEVVRGTAATLARRYAAEVPRGEVVLVVGAGKAAEAGAEARAGEAVARLVESGARARVAARVVADLTGGSANALYRGLTATSDAPSATDP